MHGENLKLKKGSVQTISLLF